MMGTENHETVMVTEEVQHWLLVAVATACKWLGSISKTRGESRGLKKSRSMGLTLLSLRIDSPRVFTIIEYMWHPAFESRYI